VLAEDADADELIEVIVKAAPNRQDR